MLIALTRAVPPSIDRCELTHLQREPIDHARAVREHAAYEDGLRQAGCRVERLPDLPENPDSVFVEDTAIVFDRIAVIARPGAESRRGETASTAAALARYRPLAYIQPPATLDGGDVLVTPGLVFVGISGRTNADGARQLATILAPHGLQVVSVSVAGCLHLKSAVTWIPLSPPESGNYGDAVAPAFTRNRDTVASAFKRNGVLVINPAWIDRSPFSGFDLVAVDPVEPAAANVLAVNGRVICADAHPNTRRRLEAYSVPTIVVPAGELAKAEGGVTCGSLVFAEAR